jgi:hypothetical protein
MLSNVGNKCCGSKVLGDEIDFLNDKKKFEEEIRKRSRR